MEAFSHDRYAIRKKLVSFVHTDFRLERPDGESVIWGRKKGFKLKEDIRLYADQGMNREILSIQARHRIDFSGTYDVIASEENRKLGALRRMGLRSIIRDEWEILDPEDRPVGSVREESQKMALLRRFLSNLIPQAFDISIGGAPVAHIRQQFNPFRHRLEVDFSPDSRRQLDRRIGVAAAVLLSMIEGRQGD